ncbi:hypothetical protein ACP6JD_000508 [Aspergillus fumigatus]
MNASSLVRASWKADVHPKQKAARMEEWAQLPLREPSDLERWLDSKRDKFTVTNDVSDRNTASEFSAFDYVRNVDRNGFTGRSSIGTSGNIVKHTK